MNLEEALSEPTWEEAYRRILSSRRENLKGVFEKAEVILCVQPHPDDTDIAAGGTVAWMTAQGKKVVYVTMTDGRIGTSNPDLYPEKLARIRMREQEEAAKTLGVNTLIWMNYRDSELKIGEEARNRLITLIRRFKPSLILTVDPWLTYEIHPDHLATGRLAAEAALFAGLPHANPGDIREGLTAHSTPFIAFYWTRKPNVYIDITSYIDVKLKAVAAHRSQFPEDSLDRFQEILKAYCKLTGKKIGVEYAEPFKLLPLSSLHCDVFAEDL